MRQLLYLPPHRLGRAMLILLVALFLAGMIALVIGVGSAQATFAGETGKNGKIAFMRSGYNGRDIYLMGSDTKIENLTNDALEN